MVKRPAHTERWSGGIAAGLLILLVTVFGAPPWIAILLSVALYIGVLLTLSNTGPTIEAPSEAQASFASAVAHLESIRTLESQVPNPDVREQVRRIDNRVSQALLAMKEDGMLAAARPFNEHLLEPYIVLLAEYVRLSTRGVKSAGHVLEKAESHDFPIIEAAVDAFYEKLNRGNIIDLATQAEMLSLHIESLGMSPQWRSRP